MCLSVMLLTLLHSTTVTATSETRSVTAIKKDIRQAQQCLCCTYFGACFCCCFAGLLGPCQAHHNKELRELKGQLHSARHAEATAAAEAERQPSPEATASAESRAPATVPAAKRKQRDEEIQRRQNQGLPDRMVREMQALDALEQSNAKKTEAEMDE